MTNQNHYRNFDITKITNAIDAEAYVLGLCKEINGKHDSQWCRDYFTATFPRLVKTTIGRELLGLQEVEKGAYRYVPRPF